MKSARRIRGVGLLFALAFLASDGERAFAQDEPARQLPAPASVLSASVSRLEDEVAQLSQKRDCTPAALLPWLELQIDSRVIARWLVLQASAARPMSAAQVADYLHATSMLSVVAMIDDYASKQSAGPTTVQAVGTVRVHQLTFQLKDAKDIAAVDNLSATVAQDLMIVFTTIQGGQQMPGLTPMRPPPEKATAESGAGSADATGTATGVATGERTPAELAALARQATVSPPLRAQLIAMANAAQQASERAASDPTQADEARTLKDELKNALDLASGLQSNTAVTSEERAQLEQQLASGLALYEDPRLRSAGSARLAALDDYRELLGRVQRMRVPAELQQALAPALAWAHENPGQGDDVLSAIEKFVALHMRFEARPSPPTEFAGLRPADPVRRAYEAVSQRFVKARGDFLGLAGALGAPAKDDGMINTSASPEALRERVGDLEQTAHLLEVLAEMPSTLKTLDALRTHPIGGLDRRVAALLVIIENPIRSPARDEATKQLLVLQQLGENLADVESAEVANVPPAVVQAYAGVEVGALQTKCKSIASEMVGEFATNQPLEGERAERLKSARKLLDSLPPAAAFEAALAKADGLAKWADWTMNAEQMRAMLAPYRAALAQAFGGFIQENPDALSTFNRVRPGSEAVMAFFSRTSTYAAACSSLPEGTTGLLDRLGTSYEKAPFGLQRYASFVAALAGSAGGDDTAGAAALSAIAARLRS
jgi:hypothetical protein